MKVHNKYIGGALKSLLFWVIALSIFFTSCKNFMEGQDILSELEKSIIYANADYARITFTCEPADACKLMIPAIGTQKNKDYKEGDTFTVRFDENPAYRFMGWSATPEGSVSFESNENETTATVCDVSSPIIVSPVVYTKKVAAITFKAEYGSISPSESKKLNPGDTIAINYTEDGNYAFLNWECIDPKTKKPFTESPVEFSGKGRDTVATVKNLTEDTEFIIRPNIVKRPNVTSYTPLYDIEGVFRDRKLTVMFDYEMDESSIYFTDDELREENVLSVSESLSDNILYTKKENLTSSGYILLRDEINENKCYGYMIPDDDDSIVYKNIKIVNKQTKENYLKFFSKPAFENGDSSVLGITTKKGNNAPPSGKHILVTFSSKFSLKDNNNVTLLNDCIWSYYTNGNTDNTPPKIDIEFYAEDTSHTIGKSIVNFDQDNKQDETGSDTTFKSSEKSDIPLYNLAHKKLYVTGKITDNSPASLSVVCKPAINSFYGVSSVTEKDLCSIPIDSNGNIPGNTKIDLSTESLREGYYQLIFVAKDKNDNQTKTTIPFYFYFDKTGPSFYSFALDRTGYGDKKVKLQCNTSNMDAEKVQFRFKKTGTDDYKYVKSESEYSDSEDDLCEFDITPQTDNFMTIPVCYRNGKQFTYEVRAKDISGNYGSWKTVNSGEYINSNGNFVYAGKEIPCTKLVDVYKTETQIHTIKEGFKLDKNVDYAGDLAKCKHNNAETITIKPYQIGGYEISEGIYNTINNNNGNVNTSKESQAALSFYVALAFCNKLSVIYGFEPCYYLGTVSTQGNWETQKNAEDWCMNISSAASIIKNYDIKCDFTKNGYRLPRTLEFEIAARGGDETKENWHYIYSGTGSTTNRRQDAGDGRYTIDNGSTGNVLGGDSDNEKHYYDVDAGNGNLLGIHGMSGNRWEWCWDLYGTDNFTDEKKTNKLNGTETGKYEDISIVSKSNFNATRSIKGGYSWSVDQAYNWAYFYPFTVFSSVPIPDTGAPINNKSFRLCRTLGADNLE